MATRTWLRLVKEIASNTGYSLNRIAQELDIHTDELFDVLANVKASQPSPQTADKILCLHHRSCERRTV